MTSTSSGQVWTAQLTAYRAAVQRRVLLVLTAVQVVAGIGVGAGVAASTLVARHLSGSDTVGGLAQTSVVLGAALVAVPTARLAAERGRRPSLTFAYGCGTLGALVAVVAVAVESWPLLLAGLLLFGGASAAGLAARYSATDLSRPGHSARDLSIVVWAATGGSVAGPLMAGQIDDAGGHLGVYALTAAVFAMATLGVFAGLRPDPLRVAHQGSPRMAIAPERSMRAALGVLRRSPSARLAVATVVVSHTAMVALMSMTPVHLDHGGAGLADVGIVISLHIAGMYAFSPLVGWCADQFGHVPVMFGGQVLLVLAALVAGLSSADSLIQVAVALFLLGVGWSCGLVAGSALLTDSVPVDLRPSVQGLSDALMNGGAAIGGLAAGALLAFASYPALSAVLLLLTLPMATALLLARRIAPA
ncbi:MFS transporter [Actinocorallia sp. API 0066]|uniref:MFS transporter n=1 Tax=Actinocorallia sp. API 0066 TaxID=2896846 RepID=UPI001E2B1C66|nr:MFS transporter [Actinocorallia sp. API 0066]MCD0448588.1 MFS transporter [Actinocorallia sp. API 0066]